jgi:hypothetical protein
MAEQNDVRIGNISPAPSTTVSTQVSVPNSLAPRGPQKPVAAHLDVYAVILLVLAMPHTKELNYAINFNYYYYYYYYY